MLEPEDLDADDPRAALILGDETVRECVDVLGMSKADRLKKEKKAAIAEKNRKRQERRDKGEEVNVSDDEEYKEEEP